MINLKMFKILMAFILVSFLSGCGLFMTEKHVNLAPFAEQTIAMMADAKDVLEQKRPIYTWRFLEEVEMEKYQQKTKKLRKMLRGIMAYSVEVVTLSESKMSGPEQAKNMEESVRTLLRPAMEEPHFEMHLSKQRLDEILDDIGKQENLLKALNAAQPIVDEVARITSENFEQLKDEQARTMQDVAGKLDEAYKEARAFFQRFRIDQEKLYRALRLISEYRDGNKEVLTEIKKSHPHLFADIPSQMGISYSDTFKVEGRLVDQLRILADARDQMNANYELYLNQQKELDEIIQTSKEAILKAQASVFVWVRAHRKLKAGIVEPAKFDLLELTKKAVDTAL